MPGYDEILYDVGVYDDTEIPTPVPPPVPGFQVPAVAPEASYQVRLYNPAGTLLAIFDEWNSLYYYKKLNEFGYHTFSIYGDDPRVDLFQFDGFIQVLRANHELGVPWYVEYDAFHRTRQDQVSDRGSQLYTSYGRTYEDLIKRRTVAYPSGTAFDTKTGPADNVMKQYVRENAGPSATVSAGRLRGGVTPNLNIAPDSSSAPSWSGSFALRNLLDTIQEISAAAIVDFDVTRAGNTFQFNTYYPRRGTDRSGVVPALSTIFAIERANMSAPYATESHTDEFNAVIVAGQGEGVDRTFAVVENTPAQLITPWNSIEKVHDARNSATLAALQSVGDEQLRLGRATRKISFTAIESPGTVYGRDVFVGDLVTARFKGLEQIKKVVGVEVTVAEGKENIRFHFDDE